MKEGTQLSELRKVLSLAVVVRTQKDFVQLHGEYSVTTALMPANTVTDSAVSLLGVSVTGFHVIENRRTWQMSTGCFSSCYTMFSLMLVRWIPVPPFQWMQSHIPKEQPLEVLICGGNYQLVLAVELYAGGGGECSSLPAICFLADFYRAGFSHKKKVQK